MHKVVAEINTRPTLLPPGVKIERFYDRKDLIDLTTHTVLHNMVVGIALIFILQWLFLGDLQQRADRRGYNSLRALLRRGHSRGIRGESANLLSVGAIDFGLVVDATVIMVESIFRGLSGHDPGAPRRSASRPSPRDKLSQYPGLGLEASAARYSFPPRSSSSASCRCSR